MGGHQQPGPICGSKVGQNYIDSGTNCRAKTSTPVSVGSHLTAAERRRHKWAIGLHAADARELLKTSLPYVFQKITDAQLQQMQMVMDAFVIDSEIQKEAQKYYNKARITTPEGYAIVDAYAERKYHQIEDQFILVDSWDKRVRFEPEQLMEPNALKPITDNPDETSYLSSIKRNLDKRGIWLQYGAQTVRDPQDPSAHVIDPHKFRVWLTLGVDGDTIPTKTGRLTRDELLNTTELGAAYYERVYLGPVQSALEREERRLRSEIDSGMDQHFDLKRLRIHNPIVSGVSDVLGGASFPDTSIWDAPSKFVLRALEMNVGGNVKASQAYLVTAALLTRNAAQLVAEYIDATSAGAERAVKVLKVAKTAGQVAEVGLAVTGVVGLVRGAATLGTGAAVADDSVGTTAERFLKRYIAENPESATGLEDVTVVRGPKGTKLGSGIKYGQSAGHGTGWDKW